MAEEGDGVGRSALGVVSLPEPKFCTHPGFKMNDGYAETKKHTPIEETGLFRNFVEVADYIWFSVDKWNPFAKSTMGRQIVNAADSVGANLVEGDARYSDGDAIHFFTIARASSRETRYWLNAAARRGPMKPEDAEIQIARITESARSLNRLISYRRSTKNANIVREERTDYATDRQFDFDFELTEEE